jgi:4-diphosphocytidyl-2-C-methyl-D-erythritol kinase
MDYLMTPSLLNCPAPAKINLFLHVNGRRADGYHLLQTAFQLLDHGDTLDFHVREDARIRRLNDVPGVSEDSDLVIRAARLLQQHTGSPCGADIAVRKRLPMGGGLGGGSSDAATCLIALNHLWQTGLRRQELMALGLQLGADVPFFIFGKNAFAEGVGEELQAIHTEPCWYVVLEPGVQVPTPAIFSAKDLTRNTERITIADFSSQSKTNWKNDLQAVATVLFPEVDEAIRWLSQFGDSRMTGSGACVFCACADEQTALDVMHQVPSKWRAWKAKTLNTHPLDELVLD